MMTSLTGGTALDPWLAADAADLPELRSFANGIRSDKEEPLKVRHSVSPLPHDPGA
jgi:hypothetical protein